MKAVRASITKGLLQSSDILCADNTGAKIVRIISIQGYKGIRRRMPSGGVGDMIRIAVKTGDVKMRHTMSHAVIIRQRADYRRKDGIHISFEDNACILTDDTGAPKGTEIKGPVAKEAIERFSTIGKIASIVV
jgi:large subunit ribosomal protein L14